MWRAKLRPASYRGVSFFVDGATLTAGRRIARHEYPQRDLPYMEDMGRKAREYKVEAFVLGQNYMAARDALLAAIEKPGAGQLVHPWHGTMVVSLQDCQLSESTAQGGYAKFSLTFIEAGKRNAPGVTADTRGLFDRAKARVLATLESVGAQALAFVGQPMSVIQDGLETLTELRSLTGVLSTITSLNSYGAAINILAGSTGLQSLLAPVSLIRGLSSLAHGLVDVEPLINFERAELPAVTVAAVQRNENRAQMVLLVRQAAVIEKVDRILSADYPSVNEAAIARTDIISAVDSVLLYRSLDHQCAQAMMDFRTAALAHMKAIAPKLPVLIDIENLCVRPAVVIAQEHYGLDWWKTGKDASLVATNKVHHPGFVPVQSLQLEVVSASR